MCLVHVGPYTGVIYTRCGCMKEQGAVFDLLCLMKLFWGGLCSEVNGTVVEVGYMIRIYVYEYSYGILHTVIY